MSIECTSIHCSATFDGMVMFFGGEREKRPSLFRPLSRTMSIFSSDDGNRRDTVQTCKTDSFARHWGWFHMFPLSHSHTHRCRRLHTRQIPDYCVSFYMCSYKRTQLLLSAIDSQSSKTSCFWNCPPNKSLNFTKNKKMSILFFLVASLSSCRFEQSFHEKKGNARLFDFIVPSWLSSLLLSMSRVFFFNESTQT